MARSPEPPRISVVIPIHNEAAFLLDALERLFVELEEVAADVDVCLAENGSTDGTPAVAAALADRRSDVSWLHLDLADYGAAMRAGFMAARGDWIVNFDIDYFSGEFLEAVLASPADVVLASKRAPSATDLRSPVRRLATRVFNLLLRIIFRSRVSDTHGMKGVRREVVAVIGPRVRSTKDLFDTELVIRAERAGYRIAEVPARVVEQRQAKSRLVSRVPRTLAGLLRLRWWLWREEKRPPAEETS